MNPGYRVLLDRVLQTLRCRPLENVITTRGHLVQASEVDLHLLSLGSCSSHLRLEG